MEPEDFKAYRPKNNNTFAQDLTDAKHLDIIFYNYDTDVAIEMDYCFRETAGASRMVELEDLNGKSVSIAVEDDKENSRFCILTVKEFSK